MVPEAAGSNPVFHPYIRGQSFSALFLCHTMSYSVYILRSSTSGQFYIGQSQDVETRLKLHNGGKVKSTKNRGPWELLYSYNYKTRSEAMSRERKLKNLKSRKRVKDWIKTQHENGKGQCGPAYELIFD